MLVRRGVLRRTKVLSANAIDLTIPNPSIPLQNCNLIFVSQISLKPITVSYSSVWCHRCTRARHHSRYSHHSSLTSLRSTLSHRPSRSSTTASALCQTCEQVTGETNTGRHMKQLQTRLFSEERKCKSRGMGSALQGFGWDIGVNWVPEAGKV